MILLDTNQIMISNLFAIKGKGFDSEELTVKDIRHSVLKGVLYYYNRFKGEYGEPMVLCYDSGNYWRTDQFPHYKASRKKKTKNDNINWNKIYQLFSVVREEISENFPFLSLQVESTEADDIIAVIAQERHRESAVLSTGGGHNDDKILIVSSDKDFQQLQSMKNVHQYSPSRKDLIKCEDPIAFLIEHIIRGDVSDGVPNILSDDDSLVNEDKKQTIMSSKRYDSILEEIKSRRISKEDSEFRRNWFRNKNLIDLGCVPKDKVKMINDAYCKEVARHAMNKNNQMDYLISNRLGDLTEFLV
tara:strand:- start:785 stop:1690 length:906 start_codon:yes stop_codon:yes gene_type:complete